MGPALPPPPRRRAAIILTAVPRADKLSAQLEALRHKAELGSPPAKRLSH
jgi:hypothetical protein